MLMKMDEPKIDLHVGDETPPMVEDTGTHPSEPPPTTMADIQKSPEQPSSQSEGDLRESIKDWASIIQSVVTVGAIALGGAWFVYQQSLKPELKLDQALTARQLGGTPHWLISIDVKCNEYRQGARISHGGNSQCDPSKPIAGESHL
jgi:hypothetical protein